MNLLKKIAFIATVVVFLPVVGCILFPEYIIGIFTKKPEIVLLAIGPLRVVTLAILMFPAAFVFLNGVSGSGDTRTAMVIELLTILIYVSYFIVK